MAPDPTRGARLVPALALAGLAVAGRPRCRPQARVTTTDGEPTAPGRSPR